MKKTEDFELLVESPGRINLIGDHVDYSGGYVLPAAIDKKIRISLRRNHSTNCSVYSKHLNRHFNIDIDALQSSNVAWENYIIGVLYFMNRLQPFTIKGFDCEIESNLPIGAGLSSSAALTCGLAKGLNRLFDMGLTDTDIIELCQKTEHDFAGVRSGIMDQFSVIHGREGKLILLHCETLAYRLIAIDLGDLELVLLNSNVSHHLASSEYNTRRAECHEAFQLISDTYTKYKTLSQVPVEIIAEFEPFLDPKLYKRALFVAMENQRTLQAVTTIENNSLYDLGKLLYASHEGLSKLYEVSCDELDFLVNFTLNNDDVVGARMMGGGFGGCTVNLVKRHAVDGFVDEIAKAYSERFGLQLTHHPVAIHNGITIV